MADFLLLRIWVKRNNRTRVPASSHVRPLSSFHSQIFAQQQHERDIMDDLEEWLGVVLRLTVQFRPQAFRAYITPANTPPTGLLQP